MRALPQGNLEKQIMLLLEPNILLPVNVAELSDYDLLKAFHNANTHMLLYAVVHKGEASREMKEALSIVRQQATTVRHKIWLLLLWRRVPLAQGSKERYRKAIREHYRLMVEAGSVLVSAVVPRHDGLYRSLCTL